jgi:hypothetical protein
MVLIEAHAAAGILKTIVTLQVARAMPAWSVTCGVALTL